MLLASLLHENFTTFNTAPPLSLLSQDTQVNLRFLFVCLLFPFGNPLSGCHYKCAGGSGHWGGSQPSSDPHFWSSVHLLCSTMSHMREDAVGLFPPTMSTWEAQELSLKKVHTASPDCCPWKGPLVKLALVGVWELGWQTVPYTDIKLSLSDERTSLCLYCLYNVTYAEYLFSFWESEVWTHLRQKLPMCREKPMALSL